MYSLVQKFRGGKIFPENINIMEHNLTVEKRSTLRQFRAHQE